jgi:hypothetical protein
MIATREFAPGGYRFIPGVFPYSAGVAALAGHAIERVRFRAPVPLTEGFAHIRDVLATAGRPLTALCACELRSPAPFTEAGFRAFNQIYVGTLAEWGLFEDEVNPVARSNVCPQIDAPPEPAFHAFAFTVPLADAPPTFVVAGSGEVPEGHKDYFDHIIACGDLSPRGLHEKARFVLAEMERRLSALGFAWHDTTATQVYTVHDLYPFLADEIVRRGAARGGLTWHFARPPVIELEYEMDCRGVPHEHVV